MTNFHWCLWVAERIVECARTQDQGFPGNIFFIIMGIYNRLHALTAMLGVAFYETER